MKRLVILISGRGSNLSAMVDQIRSQGWPIQVVRVISNRADAKGLAFAARHGIPTSVMPHRDYASREAFDTALADAIEADAPDLVALAGFMRILSPAFCARFNGRLLNIHPSLLPAFAGLDTHRRAIDAGVKLHGCTVHSVTVELDHGPIIAQAAVPVLPTDDEEQLARRVLKMEHRIYPMAVAAVLSGRIRLHDGRWMDQGRGDFDHPYTPCLMDGAP
jgi:phosphoribosylglycinamide formyltransferase-1